MASSAEVQIIINAVNNAAKTMLGLEKDIMDVKKAAQAGTDFLNGMGVSIDGLFNPAMMAGKAVRFLSDQVKEGVKFNVDYAKQVEDTSRKLGISAGEASKLIQVTDDLRIEYSTLSLAMRTALDKGITPSIENLAKMGQEYRALQTPVEKAQYAIERFGSRAGLEMQKVLEMSSEELLAMGDAVAASGLMMDEKGVQAAKDYALAVDSLGDSWNGLRNRLVRDIIPALTDVTNTISDAIAFQDLLAEAKKRGIKIDMKFNGQTMVVAETVETLTKKIKANEQALVTSKKAINDFRTEERGITLDTNDAAEAQMRLAETMDRRTTSAYEAASNAASTYKRITWDVIDATHGHTEKVAALIEKLDLFRNLDYSTVDLGLSSAIASELSEIRVMLAGGGEFDDVFSNIKTLMEQKKITPEEAQMFMSDVEINWVKSLVKAGEISAAEGKKMIQETLHVTPEQAARIWEELPKSAQDIMDNVTLHVKTIAEIIDIQGTGGNYQGQTGGGNSKKRAAGGPVAAGAAYIVGEHGPEMFVPRQAGQIVPNHITNNWGGINISGGNMTPQDVARAIGREFDRRR